jgi:hypothetical protein
MNSHLLLTLPYCTKDAMLLRKCVHWMRELQPDGYNHSCLLVADNDVPHEQKAELQKLCKGLFSYAETMIVAVPQEMQGWPLGPNYMFASAARQIAEAWRLPWLWLEPDATPLRPGWLDTIGNNYAIRGKRFMGTIIPSENQPDMPPLHLSGCSVYDNQAYYGLQPFTGTKLGFDIAAAGFTVPRASHFAPMQHFWGKHDKAPTFNLDPTKEQESVLGYDFILPDSVTFHRCKDGSLIDLLRSRANSHPVKKTAVAKPRPAHNRAAVSSP